MSFLILVMFAYCVHILLAHVAGQLALRSAVAVLLVIAVACVAEPFLKVGADFCSHRLEALGVAYDSAIEDFRDSLGEE